MAVLDVLTYPNPLLKQVSEPVSELDEQIVRLIADLVETLDYYPGCVGVAAPQTGNLKRIIVIDASRNRKPVPNHGRHVLINPVIEWQDGEETAREGCLSLPDFTANVKRSKAIRCRAMNPLGEEVLIETSDFEARVILHESDHLNGILFLDRVSSLKTDVFRRKRYQAPEAGRASSESDLSIPGTKTPEGSESR
jgi:peptide deformylase